MKWGPHSDLTMCYESHFIDRERESAFRRNPRRIQIKSHPPCFPNLFFYPHLRPTLAKKSASTCKIRKDRLQKYPKRRSHQETECCVSAKSALLAATAPAVDHHSSSSRSSSPSLTLSLLHCCCTGHCTKLCAVRGRCKCKRCRPQQRLQLLFQRLTPLSSSDFTFSCLAHVCSCIGVFLLLTMTVCRCMYMWHYILVFVRVCMVVYTDMCVCVTFSQNS